ncbi:uncharacterized protein [Gossypium hirsutum]|uniref:Uncharacterized protein isoform X1 n=1 Tax=Gossypium hirsutum TaxID=3635 RepID=A0ABM3A5S4_GOSHI|nr:uncharacterized protein LOC121217835 isoform X1 [Gossypium hirsutum]
MVCMNLFSKQFRAGSSFDVWSTVLRRFAAKSSLTVLTFRHSLYSQKKGQLSIQEYLAKIQGQCDTLLAVGTNTSNQEQINIILAGLPVKYESIRIIASAMNVSLDYLTKMLTDSEARQ